MLRLPNSDHSNDTLAAKLMPSNGTADFVLGMQTCIKPSGASYLLLPSTAMSWRPRGRPRHAHEFESLSPVQFPTQATLATKFSMLASNKKSSDGRPRDRSKANTSYTAGGDGLSADGIARSAFEHQRMYYLMCQEDPEEPLDYVRYALRPAPWFKQTRLFSFTFNTWAADDRALDERKASPKVLDVGWTEFNPPTHSTDLDPFSTSHYIVEESKYLRNPEQKLSTLPNVSQTMPKATIGDLLKDLFAFPRDGGNNSPKILLVHDEVMTRCILHGFGVDTSRWKVGIKELLYCPDARGPQTRQPYSDSKREPYDRFTKRPRDRSLSPRRRTTTRDPRPRSPPATPTQPSVYLVDVREMCQTLRQTRSTRDTILSNSKIFNVKDTPLARDATDSVLYEDVDLGSYCAGKESRLLGYIWEEMAKGTAIDEQRAEREYFMREDSLAEAARSAFTGGDIDPNDIDPNDVAQSQHGARASKSRPVGMFDSDSEDDEY
ncbi:hypothetical protein BD413DRAFT_600149 [Trametes elegans]|nr:hypothetical protein BD413DRAFT_600149 [Trametes elegans]